MTEQGLTKEEVIRTVEDIEELQGLISSHDYARFVCQGKPREAYHADEASKFQRQENNLVNRLKDYGVTLDYDGERVYVSKDGKPWLRRDKHKQWRESSLNGKASRFHH